MNETEVDRSTKMRRVHNYVSCLDPGDFYWLVYDPDIQQKVRPAQDGEAPHLLAFMDEHRRVHQIQVKPSTVAKTWRWNGDLGRPTLMPSIRSFTEDHKGNQITLWHGHVTDGELIPCHDSPA